MKLGVVICANGRGHRIRVERVLSALKRRAPDLEVRLHEERAVTWSRDPSVYDDGRLLDWHKRAETLDVLMSDVVLSDNLPAVLKARPDALLMGSFLWSDVLARAHPGSAAVRAFAERDDALLARHRPDMICLETFAMPAVRERTHARGVGIIARAPRNDSALKRGEDMGLVFAAGGTGAADALLAPLKAKLELRGPCVWRDEVESISNAAAVIGRPGIGTITECIEDGVPLLAVFEAQSPEMEHNAARLEALGLGASVRGEPLRVIDDAVADIVARRAEIAVAAATLARDGAERAAEIVWSRLKEGKAA